MKFRTKLIVGFSIPTTMLLIIGIVSTLYFTKMVYLFEELSERAIKIENEVDEGRQLIDSIHSSILNAMLTSMGNQAESFEKVDQMAVGFYQVLERLGELRPEDKEKINALKDKFQRFYVYGKWILELPDLQTFLDQPDTIKKFEKQKNELLLDLNNAFTIYKVEFRDSLQSIHGISNDVFFLLVAIVIIGCFCSAIISIILSKNLTRPLFQILSTVKQLENKHFSARAEVYSHDEIGLLATAFNNMAEQLDQTFQQLKSEIDKRTRSEEEINRLRNLMSNIINSMPSVLIGIDNTYTINQWNFEASKKTRIQEEEAIGKKLSDLIPQLDEYRDTIDQAIKNRKIEKVEKIVWAEEGERKICDLLVYPLLANGINGAVVRLDDVTQRVTMEEMMIQTEKMASIGGLAAGMAHEINNPLGVILNLVQLIEYRISPEFEKNLEAAREFDLNLGQMSDYLKKRKVYAYLEEIKKSGVRAANIISEMLLFSRKSASEAHKSDMVPIINQAIDLAQKDFNLKKKFDFKHIKIIKEFQCQSHPVFCVESQIEQVLLNLLRNAAQALETTKDDAPPQITLRILNETDQVTLWSPGCIR